ncbi:NUDIX hydrolase [Lapillicoccus jejuensis]|uniref:NUDIX domain-containing protein n=1 Tax=Lapillicoccus jejuensis TaxID=402171 RepID=A0A542DXV8_9MICO|nr:CoA pyrophosphatase [Lapillicoccus jejuensis]TQJ07906.1 NUDIX domain-containing protein [Lapillicoccus jejuensis]
MSPAAGPVASFARYGETLVPRHPAGRAARPAYLDTLLRSAAQVDPSWFSRFLPPDGEEDLRQSSVLLLFGPDPRGVDSLVLTERSHRMRAHPGQISLPGGGAEPGDADVAATALREAHEEVGLDPAGVEVLGELPALFLPYSSNVVTTVVGWWREPSPVTALDPAEVETVVLAPLDLLTDPAHRHTVVHPSGYRGPAFDLGEDLLLWGFTGGLVGKALELAGLDRPWDAGVTRPLPDRFAGGRRG